MLSSSRVSQRHVSRRAVLAALGLAGLPAGACTRPNDTASSAPTVDRRPGERITLTFWSWVPGLDKAVELWNQGHPEVQIELSKIPEATKGGYAKIHSALEAGTPPDLAQIEFNVLPEFLLDQGLVDLRPLGIDRYRDRFVDWQWRQAEYAGGMYAVPQASGPVAMYYRADKFQEWGISPPRTWQEYEQAARIVRRSDPDAYLTTFSPNTPGWFTALAWQSGAKWFGTDGDTWTVHMTGPETRQVTDFWDRMWREGLIMTEQDQVSGWFSDLQRGRILSWVGPQWGDAILQENAPDLAGRWRVAPMPQWRPGGTVAANFGGSTTGVMRGTRYPKDALDFALWLNTDPQSVNLLIAGGYGWPAAAGAGEWSDLNKPYPYFGGQRVSEVFADADAGVDRSWLWSPTTTATYQHLADGFQEAVASEKSFTEVLSDVQAKSVDDLLAKGLQARAGGAR